jgi:dihydroflavonol-4-reductase
MKKIAFVTGSTGFLGLNLVKKLHENGWKVIAMHRPNSDTKYLERLGVERVQGDIRDYDSLAEIMPNKLDAIFHLAASTNLGLKHKQLLYESNVEGTKNVLNNAIKKGAKKIIFTSSISSYGQHVGFIDEYTKSNALTKKNNYYNITKFMGEQIIKNANAEGLIEGIILNPCRIMGPYDKDNWATFIKMAINQKVLIVPKGKGMLCHAEDVADAHISAYENGKGGENYLLGGTVASFKDIINSAEFYAGIKSTKGETKNWMVYMLSHLLPLYASIMHQEPKLTPERAYLLTSNVLCDFQKAKTDLNYKTSSVDKIINDSLSWLKKENLLEMGYH